MTDHCSRWRSCSFGLAMAVAALMAFPQATMADSIIHREKSLYRNIVVKEDGDRRCLLFSVRREQRNQTCIDLSDPNRLIFPYVRMTLTGLLVNPEPKKGLMIGLGGGTLSNVLTELYPELVMDLIEVDAAVVKVAREYFNFEETDRTRVHVVDGRVFVRRAALRGETYDFIILDAFTGEYIPEHLMTREFLMEVRNILTEDGVAIANTFVGSRLYHHESATYANVFESMLNLKMSGTGNRVILAGKTELPDNKTLMETAAELDPHLTRYDVSLMSYVPNLSRTPDWSEDARILTDQYSPANLLKEQ